MDPIGGYDDRFEDRHRVRGGFPKTERIELN